MADEQVRFDILVEAKAAIQELREMSKEASSVQERVSKFSAFLVAKSRQWNVPVKELLKTFKDLNAEMAKQKTQTIFGNVGGQNVFNLTDKYLQAAQAAGRFKTNSEGVAQAISKTGDAAKKSAGEFEIWGNKINVVRTAFGTLLAVGIFQFLNALSAAFTQFIHNLRETELAVYNLINAEKRLSEQGIDVTPKGLEETIQKVRELVPILSQVDAEELVSRIATNVAPALKLTNEEIEQMATSVALLYVRNKALGKSLDEVESQVTNAYLTGKVSVGLNNLGIKISDQIVKDEALRMGLVKTEEEFNNLTGEIEAQIKARAMLSIMTKNANDDAEAIGEYMETVDAQAERTSKAWSDLLTVLGNTGLSTYIAKVIGLIADALEGWVGIITYLKPIMMDFLAGSIAGWQTLGFLMMNPLTSWEDAVKKFSEFKGLALEEMMEGLGNAIDTPTANINELQNAVDNFDAEKFAQEVEDIRDDLRQAQEDLDTKMGQKRADIDLEYQRKAADAEKDYLRKVADINRDAERDLANLKEKQREEDLRAEEDYQNKLWELRMRFLMDLEEALHARDARQVIRLQKQYEIDKEALERKKNLDDKQREEDQQNQIEDIELKRQQRLEDAKLEYDQKLFDQRLAKQRELDDLNVWYKREQDDLQKNIERKLQALIKGWIDEQKITEANAAKVYGILYKYFGPGGMTDQLYQYMASQLQVPLPMPMMTPITGYSAGGGLASGSTGGSTGSRPANRRVGGLQMAEGGTFVATRPTTVTFGEAGAEMATFTPLSRIGKNVNTVFSNGQMGGLQGQITVRVDLSPDLEARVVENSMNGVAEVVAKINRTKL